MTATALPRPPFDCRRASPPPPRLLALTLTAALLPPDAAAQARKDSVILGMVLEPRPASTRPWRRRRRSARWCT